MIDCFYFQLCVPCLPYVYRISFCEALYFFWVYVYLLPSYFQGCSLRNTEYIVGAVIFTGHETKVSCREACFEKFIGMQAFRIVLLVTFSCFSMYFFYVYNLIYMVVNAMHAGDDECHEYSLQKKYTGKETRQTHYYYLLCSFHDVPHWSYWLVQLLINLVFTKTMLIFHRIFGS